MYNKTISEQLIEDCLDRAETHSRCKGVGQPPPGLCNTCWRTLGHRGGKGTHAKRRRTAAYRECARWHRRGSLCRARKRLRPSIRSGEGQLRKFSARGFATIICLYDTTASFHDADFNVQAALYGDEALRFAVPHGGDQGQFVGSGPGKNAMLRPNERNAVSAVAIVRHPAGSTQVDLYHNPLAAIKIARALAAPFVNRQIP